MGRNRDRSEVERLEEFARRVPVDRIRRGLPGAPIGCVTLVVAAVAALILFFWFTARVDAGEACAVTRFGDVVREEGPGLHLRVPFIDRYHCFRSAATFYEVLEQPGQSGADYVDSVLDGVTRDGQPVTITLNLRYHIPKENVAEIYTEVGRTMGQINEKAVKFHTRAIVRQQVQKYTATQLYSGDLDVVSRSMADVLRPLFAESYVVLEYLELKRPRFQPAYEQAIEAQQVALEQIETRANEAAAAEQEALRVANLAQGDANAQRIRAEGEAQAIALRGKAVRENPEIITLNYIEALRTINWAILDSDSITPFLNIQPPGGGGDAGAGTIPSPTAQAIPPPPADTATLDTDGDGVTDADEITAGTDPADPASVPR